MNYLFKKPQSLNHIGGRNNNEDSIYPLTGNANINDKLFLVCDGVGGNEKGEVASRLACDKFVEYFKQNLSELSNEKYIAMALEYTEEAFDQYIVKNPESKGMGTTLTLLHFHTNGATVAHIGDSRVYQFRNGQPIFQTSDHSLVNDLLKAGVLDEEQAKDHPQKNVISRAIQGALVKKTKVDVSQIKDIQNGDYFFLCTDGIQENISDFEIGQILLQNISDTEKMALISKRCEENPNDNFSAYLLHIAEVEGAIVENNDEVVVEATIIEDQIEEVQIQKPMLKSIIDKLGKFEKLKKILPLFLISVVVIISIKFWEKPKDKKDEVIKVNTEEIINKTTKAKTTIVNQEEEQKSKIKNKKTTQKKRTIQ